MASMLVTVGTFVWSAPAQPPAATAPATQPAAHPTQVLGMRSARVTLSLPRIDRVVLVPDAATYLDERRKWSLAGRWPV